MQVSTSRRAFFTGRVNAPEAFVPRPPWSLQEAEFLGVCTRCGECAKACGAGVVQTGAGGYPEVSFSLGECTFCGDCVDACRPGALNKDRAGKPWSLIARIGDGCLSAGGVTCRVCGDMCDAGAIRFQPRVGGRADPVVDLDACTGCGACVKPCPTGVVDIVHVSQSVEEAVS
ncbi:MAG: ferredoxin-type protein NapF [Alphaproteobacteria bacterium]|nr:ferredoxin-type protein NapF [Alphaproteobacteria bacterium]